MKLSRITALSHFGRREIVGTNYLCGKVYSTERLEKDLSSIDAYIPRIVIGDTPNDLPPNSFVDLPTWFDTWVRFALSDIAKDLGDPAGLFRPLLRDLRLAIEAMPDVPPLPEPGSVNYMNNFVLADVANEFKRYRDWARTSCQASLSVDVKTNVHKSSAPLQTGTNVKEEDVPAAYRDGGKLDGAVLTTNYLKDKDGDWNLLGPYLNKNYGPDKTLTTHIMVGKQKAYLFKEIAALRAIKTGNEAKREENA